MNRPTTDDPTHAHDVDLDDTFDFLNTSELEDGSQVERLTSLDEALDWFLERGVIHHEGAQHARDAAIARPANGVRALGRIRRVRDALREVSDAVVAHETPDLGAVEVVNDALRSRQLIELVPAPGGVGVDHRHVGDPVDDALARLADPLVIELASGDPERIRVCANDTCRWVFYDSSRSARRRWCDMATCGNRAKAARHRARQRTADAGSDAPAI